MDQMIPATETMQWERSVLILDFDLFKHIGGGQSVYHKIIAGQPKNRFYYLRREEKPDAPKPPNAVPVDVPPRPVQRTRLELQGRARHFSSLFFEAMWIADAITRKYPGISFDIVDCPDYSHRGIFIRDALQHHGIDVGALVLALHGSLSVPIRVAWPDSDPALGKQTASEIEWLDAEQLSLCDGYYAISESYAKERGILPICNILDPVLITRGILPTPIEKTNIDPDLVFVGRDEKWKGPDLFLDLVWSLDPGTYGKVRFIGPETKTWSGVSSLPTLQSMARHRRITPVWEGALDGAGIQALFKTAVLPFIPSRYDTFNLVALEAVMSGCPAAVSRQAGVAKWLSRHLPDELVWLVDLDCSRSGFGVVDNLIRNYYDCRNRLCDWLLAHPIEGDPASLQSIYSLQRRFNLQKRQYYSDLYWSFNSKIQRPKFLVRYDATLTGAREVVRTYYPRPIRHTMSHIKQGIKTKVKETITTRMKLSPRTVDQFASMGRLPRPVVITSGNSVSDRISELSAASGRNLVGRIPLFDELARLERLRGNNLVAATYELRLMRWWGADQRNRLPWTANTLRKDGFELEAETAEAMYGGPEVEREARCAEIMRNARTRNLSKTASPLARLVDTRADGASPRVSVIVSLYKTQKRLTTLLQSLEQQTLAREGQLEVILIDSNSPHKEYEEFEAFARRGAFPIVYARSFARETIQAAWNRGIDLARGEYLSFLGVDEGLHPSALQRLATVLDQNPAVDWAMADSVVTNVTADGTYDSEIMTYDRTGYCQDLVMLETCYLSWVGGMYRKNVHDRFGYYDESFGAAGDTEFKCRVIPNIQSVHIPEILGVFNNYPDERTTHNPRAELEDLRAWYLWRTIAGVEVIFGHRSVDHLISQFRRALNYRKSYCGHLSTDFDYALALAKSLARRDDRPSWADQAVREVESVLELIRMLESNVTDRAAPRAWSIPSGSSRLLGSIKSIRAKSKHHAETFGLESPPFYEIFNDNRFEQHWWSWS